MRERKLPKWYWCDAGLVRALKGSSGPVVPEERGFLFEGLVAQVLRAYRDYRRLFEDFYYWKTAAKSGIEVDFLLNRGEQFIAIEVKSGNTFSETWCKGLRAISALKGLRRRILVYPRGPRLKTEDSIEILAFTDFSNMLASDTLWGE